MSKLNLNESIRRLDADTDCKYDLYNMFSYCDFDDSSKSKLAEMFAKNKKSAVIKYITEEFKKKEEMKNGVGFFSNPSPEAFNASVGEELKVDDTFDESYYTEYFSENPLDGIRSNTLEFPNGEVLYLDYEDGKLFAGSATNTGIIHEFEIDYDNDFSVDKNLQDLYDVIVEQRPELMDELTEGIDKKYMRHLEDKVSACSTKQDLEDIGADLTGLSNADIGRILDGDYIDGDIEKMFGGYSFVDDDFGESLKESVKINDDIKSKVMKDYRLEYYQKEYDTTKKLFDKTQKELLELESELYIADKRCKLSLEFINALYDFLGDDISATIDDYYSAKVDVVFDTDEDYKKAFDLFNGKTLTIGQYDDCALRFLDDERTAVCVSRSLMDDLLEIRKGNANDIQKESLKESNCKRKSLTESSKPILDAIEKHFDGNIPVDALDVIEDLVDRAVSDLDEGYDVEGAVQDAIDSGLIYTRDIWKIKAFYGDADLSDEEYENLFNDVYSIVSSISDGGVDESLKESKDSMSEQAKELYNYTKSFNNFPKITKDAASPMIAIRQKVKRAMKAYCDEHCSPGTKFEDIFTEEDFQAVSNKLYDELNETDESLKEDLTIREEYETDLTDFEFWSGGADTVEDLTEDELRTISHYLEDLYPEGMTETEVNDFFWFERDTIAEWLGYEDYEDIMRRDEEEDD